VDTTVEMTTLEVTLDAIHPNPWNPNKQTERVMTAVRESIREFGFIDPITVRPHPTREAAFEILGGEHRWIAARAEGIDTVPVTVLHGLSDAQAKKLVVILNETRGEADTALLGRLLSDIQRELEDENDLRLGLPYSEEELRQLTSVADDEITPPPPPPAGNGRPTPREPLKVNAVTLTYGEEQQVDRFRTLARIVQHERQEPDEATAVLRALEETVERIEGGG
jgi:hypothetical protein